MDDRKRPKDYPDDKHHKRKKHKKKEKVVYSPSQWSSSSSESEYEALCTPLQLAIEHLPPDVTEDEMMEFFNRKPRRVVIYRFENQDAQGVIIFKNVRETKEGLGLSGKPMQGVPIYIKPNGNSRNIVRASGFSNKLSVKYVKKQLRSEFNSRGEVLNIFVPEDNKAGGGCCLGFGYIFIDRSSEDLEKPFEIDGLPVAVCMATPKVCFQAEILGKNYYVKKEKDENKKTALKKVLLPLDTSLQTLMHTQETFCWNDNRPDITAEDYYQESNDCWAAALQRAYSALGKLSGSPGQDLTLEDILDGVDAAHQASGNGLNRLKNAISFMERYVKEMKIHRRPRGDDVSSYEEFEIFILQLLKTTPVMVTIECVPSFLDFKGKGIYCPPDMECHLRNFEKFPIHCLLSCGNSMRLRDEIGELTVLS